MGQGCEVCQAAVYDVEPAGAGCGGRGKTALPKVQLPRSARPNRLSERCAAMKYHQVTDGFRFRDDRTAWEYRADPQRPKLPPTWYRMESPSAAGLAIDEIFRLRSVIHFAAKLDRLGGGSGLETDLGTVWRTRGAAGYRVELDTLEPEHVLTATDASLLAHGLPGSLQDKVTETLEPT